MSDRSISPQKMEMAFAALEFRKDLDALLAKHGATLHFGWEGKWAYLQVLYPAIDPNLGLTLIKADKRGKQRYITAMESGDV